MHRRAMLLVVSVLTILTMVASPAFAHDWDGDGWDEELGFWIWVPVFVEFDVEFDDIDIEDEFDCDWDECDFDVHDFDVHDFDDDDWDDHHFDDHDGRHHDRDKCEGPVCLID